MGMDYKQKLRKLELIIILQINILDFNIYTVSFHDTVKYSRRIQMH